MRLPDKVKFLLVLCSGLIFFVSGCVDTSVQSIPDQIVYHSQLEFANLVAGAGTATITMNGESVGTVAFGDVSTDMTVQAGSKKLNVAYSTADNQEYLLSTETDYKLRIYFIGDANSNMAVKKLQRYIFQTPNVPQDTAHVAFFNGSPDITLDAISFNSTDTTDVDLGLDLGGSQSYTPVKSGAYTFSIAYNDSLETSFSDSHTLNAKQRYTVAVYDTLGSLKLKVFTDD
jgi:hypothetical protein